jgi:hypothetical protein
MAFLFPKDKDAVLRRPDSATLTFISPLASLAKMFRAAGRFVTILALCCAIGLHWVALQSLAWTTMIVEYSKHAPLRAAITQTFDGTHPCSLCHAVNAGKTSEKKADLQSPTPKIDMICALRAIRLVPAFAPFVYAPVTFSSPEIAHSPPVPPPRSLS